MSKQTDAIGAGTGISVPLCERVAGWRERAERGICLLDARMRTLTAEPEEGAATAEYAVVLVAPPDSRRCWSRFSNPER